MAALSSMRTSSAAAASMELDARCCSRWKGGRIMGPAGGAVGVLGG